MRISLDGPPQARTAPTEARRSRWTHARTLGRLVPAETAFVPLGTALGWACSNDRARRRANAHAYGRTSPLFDGAAGVRMKNDACPRVGCGRSPSNNTRRLVSVARCVPHRAADPLVLSRCRPRRRCIAADPHPPPSGSARPRFETAHASLGQPGLSLTTHAPAAPSSPALTTPPRTNRPKGGPHMTPLSSVDACSPAPRLISL